MRHGFLPALQVIKNVIPVDAQAQLAVELCDFGFNHNYVRFGGILSLQVSNIWSRIFMADLEKPSLYVVSTWEALMTFLPSGKKDLEKLHQV